MTLDEMLKKINWKKAEYFKWKFDIRYDQRLPKKTEEEFLNSVNARTMNAFINWEKDPEYKALLQLYLDYKSTQDFEEIYNLVSEKAKKDGNDKDVKLFLQLKKEIKDNQSIVKEIFKEEDNEIDDLKV
ncbi:hypothetical protein [Ornithinibacillus sp. 179-J 7C1 HS]|uniref:hypothetical protein n=1 Tax=Ornithinibacillus sp. 179-J 7C1 HS TaxID=3142384 RepID=UPI0039A10DF1